jgi:hypothetical protein
MCNAAAWSLAAARSLGIHHVNPHRCASESKSRPRMYFRARACPGGCRPSQNQGPERLPKTPFLSSGSNLMCNAAAWSLAAARLLLTHHVNTHRRARESKSRNRTYFRARACIRPWAPGACGCAAGPAVVLGPHNTFHTLIVLERRRRDGREAVVAVFCDTHGSVALAFS